MMEDDSEAEYEDDYDDDYEDHFVPIGGGDTTDRLNLTALGLDEAKQFTSEGLYAEFGLPYSVDDTRIRPGVCRSATSGTVMEDSFGRLCEVKFGAFPDGLEGMKKAARKAGDDFRRDNSKREITFSDYVAIMASLGITAPTEAQVALAYSKTSELPPDQQAAHESLRQPAVEHCQLFIACTHAFGLWTGDKAVRYDTSLSGGMWGKSFCHMEGCKWLHLALRRLKDFPQQTNATESGCSWAVSCCAFTVGLLCMGMDVGLSRLVCNYVRFAFAKSQAAMCYLTAFVGGEGTDDYKIVMSKVTGLLRPTARKRGEPAARDTTCLNIHGNVRGGAVLILNRLSEPAKQVTAIMPVADAPRALYNAEKRRRLECFRFLASLDKFFLEDVFRGKSVGCLSVLRAFHRGPEVLDPASQYFVLKTFATYGNRTGDQAPLMFTVSEVDSAGTDTGSYFSDVSAMVTSHRAASVSRQGLKAKQRQIQAEAMIVVCETYWRIHMIEKYTPKVPLCPQSVLFYTQDERDAHRQAELHKHHRAMELAAKIAAQTVRAADIATGLVEAPEATAAVLLGTSFGPECEITLRGLKEFSRHLRWGYDEKTSNRNASRGQIVDRLLLQGKAMAMLNAIRAEKADAIAARAASSRKRNRDEGGGRRR